MINRRSVLVGCTAFGIGVFATTAFAKRNDLLSVMAKRLLNAVSPLGDRSRGANDAPVVMVVYGSMTCEHSAEFNQVVWPALNEKYVGTGKLRMIFRELPLDNLALSAFVLARSVPEEKYFALLDMMWRRQKFWRTPEPKAELFKIMQLTGMTIEKFESVLSDKDSLAAVYKAGKAAQAEFAIKKTPTIFINGRLVSGHEDPAEFITMIDEELAT